MVAIRALFAVMFSILCLAGCTSSETRSLVSKVDLPANKYQKIAVFIEDPNPAARPSPQLDVGAGQITLSIPGPSGSATTAEIEQSIISALNNVGVVASNGPILFNGRTLDDKTKASILQKNFDAVLYVTVLANGMKEKRVEGAQHNRQHISVGGETKEIDIYDQNKYELKDDGSVWENVPTFYARSELQDTKTNKTVWTSETITTGGTLVLLSRASKQLVEKMRADGAI